MAEAKELGVSFFVVAGGEPFLRAELVRITRDYPQIVFLVFTNGLLIDEEKIEAFVEQKNLVPMVSLEGKPTDTDGRRGRGTHDTVLALMRRMQEKKVFFGASLTLTKQTFSTILDESYIRDLVNRGCRFFLFLEYTAAHQDTENWILTKEQWEQVPTLINGYRERFPSLFIAVPWDEDEVGGCLAAGRGFVHINAQGDVEPCPFAPFSDTDVRTTSLKDALQSEFLRKLRDRPELLAETGGGCGLWKNRVEVQTILDAIRPPTDREEVERRQVRCT
jgi:MoaA/NifB/PqqE/SkfB family radical SAM enzyme